MSGVGDGPDPHWLSARCAAVGAVAGSVHRLTDGALRLTAAHRLPPAVIERTRIIPRGKGMAGLAWQRAAPVRTCDLQRDPTDDIQPGARAVSAGQAIALPLLSPDGAVFAVVGFAFRDAGEFDPATVERLARAAAELPPEGGYSR